jgi:hypothetical protein
MKKNESELFLSKRTSLMNNYAPNSSAETRPVHALIVNVNKENLLEQAHTFGQQIETPASLIQSLNDLPD